MALQHSYSDEEVVIAAGILVKHAALPAAKALQEVGAYMRPGTFSRVLGRKAAPGAHLNALGARLDKLPDGKRMPAISLPYGSGTRSFQSQEELADFAAQARRRFLGWNKRRNLYSGHQNALKGGDPWRLNEPALGSVTSARQDAFRKWFEASVKDPKFFAAQMAAGGAGVAATGHIADSMSDQDIHIGG